MNIKELEKLRVAWDEDNECWCITNSDNKFNMMADCDIAYDLEIPLKEYFKILTDNGGYYIDEEYNMLGFKTKEIAEQCLQTFKNYKEGDIIEKVSNPMRFRYLNWQGEISIRNVTPIKLWYGNTDYHKENQWFMKAYDIDKCSERDFAMMDIIEYIKVEEI